MKPKDFKRWRKSLGLSQKAAAESLGLKRRVVQYYEKGERDGKDVEIPKTVRLACYALTEGVSDYNGPREAAERSSEPVLRLVTNSAPQGSPSQSLDSSSLAVVDPSGTGRADKKAPKNTKNKAKDSRDGKNDVKAGRMKTRGEKTRSKDKARARENKAEKAVRPEDH